jgi:multidrug resistance efflux pump
VQTKPIAKESAPDSFTTEGRSGLLTIAPPWSVALVTLLSLLFVGLGLLAWFGRVRVYTQGRGVVRLSSPAIVVRAPFGGTVLTVEHGAGDRERAGALLLRLDAHIDEAAQAECAQRLPADTIALDAMERRLREWREAPTEREAALTLVLIAQMGAQRESVTSRARRCEDLQRTLDRSRLEFPVDAVVDELAVAAGAQVREGDVLATLVPSSAHLIGYLALPEQYGMDLAVGQPVRLRFDALPFDQVGVGRATVARVLDALPSDVKLEAPSGRYAELSIDAMPRDDVKAHAGMTFTGDVFVREGRVIDVLFGRSPASGR